MKKLMKGNEAIAEAAIQAGCKFFFGYPITPQNEIPEYMSRRLPQVGGCFLQAESEVAAINMVYGAGGAGARVMTSSSSPGISLKQEGISYIAGAEVPCVIVNIVRGGPGLGGIQPAQSDYYQATRGGGHGDYRLCVLAPSSVQEAVDLTKKAFAIADHYRNPVMVLGDGMIGQMMEPVDMEKTANTPDIRPVKPWAADGHVPTPERPRSIINSLYIDPKVLEQHCLRLEAKYQTIAENECDWQEEMLDDAEIVLVAYGTTSRICRSAMRKCREEGIKVGLLRPITVWPFPTEAIRRTIPTAKHYLTVEMSTGQMVEDVRLAVEGKRPVHFYGRTGGMVPAVSEIIAEIKKYAGVKAADDSAGEADEIDLNRVLKATADKTMQMMKEAKKMFDESSFDEIEVKFKATLGKMKQKLQEAGDKIDETSSDEMKQKVKRAAETMTQRMKEAAKKMEQTIDAAGKKYDSAPLDEIEADLDQAASELDQAVEEAEKAMDEAVNDTAAQPDEPKAEAAQETADTADTKPDGTTLEDIGKTLEAAAKAMEEKFSEAGKKIDELLSNPETQQKAEDAGKQIGDFLDRTGKSVTGGFETFMKIVNHAAETVKSDLKDRNKSDNSQDKEDE